MFFSTLGGSTMVYINGDLANPKPVSGIPNRIGKVFKRRNLEGTQPFITAQY